MMGMVTVKDAESLELDGFHLLLRLLYGVPLLILDCDSVFLETSANTPLIVHLYIIQSYAAYFTIARGGAARRH